MPMRMAIVYSILLGGTAVAQTADPTVPPPAEPSAEPSTTTQSDASKPKEPKAGDFDAGGQVRLPNGPDAMGQYKTYNWIAVDLHGKYFITKNITVDGFMPVAVVHPDVLADGMTHPKMFGGAQARFDLALGKMPSIPLVPHYDTDVGLTLNATYMHERAMLLSDKDFPLFTGDVTPGVSGGLRLKLKLSSLLDFALVPSFVYQGGGKLSSVDALQIPTSLIIKIGSLVKLSADAGIYTGDGLAFGGKSGGRITAGGALDVKIGPIITHLGGGVASLLTGGAYPTIGDSVYVDLNVKYAK